MLQIHPEGPIFSRLIPGLMRLNQWQMSAGDLLEWVKAAADMGLTTFDHADIYGGYTNEARFGEALALDPSMREKIQLVSKCGIQLFSENRPQTIVKHYNTSREHIIASAERSLQNLQTDYLDLLLIHRPDQLMNPVEVGNALQELVKAGKVRYVGVSNFTPSQFETLQNMMNIPLVTNQVEFSVNYLDPLTDGTFDQAFRYHYAPMIWSPLGGGRIFQPDTPLYDMLRQVGDELGGKGVDQVALAWTMQHPVNVLPVLGTGKLERLQAAVDALQIQMDRQQWFRIWQAAAGHEIA
jgi:predicted oxidoreductase